MGKPERQYQPVDLLEFERRLLARTESSSGAEEDPLAELARIIGGGRIVTSDEEASSLDPAPAAPQPAPSYRAEYEPEPYEAAPPSVWPPAEQPQPTDLSRHEAAVQLARIYRTDYEPEALAPGPQPVWPPQEQSQLENLSQDEDPSQDQAALEPSFDDHADECENADLDWRDRLKSLQFGNENVPIAPLRSDARQRLRNHKRPGTSLYVTTAAMVVAGIAAGLFMRSGSSTIGPAEPRADTLTIVKTPSGTGNSTPPVVMGKPAPTKQANTDTGAQLASAPPPNPAGDAVAVAGPASPPADAPPSFPQDDASIPSPKRVRTVPIHGNGIAEMSQIMSNAAQNAPAPGLTYGQVVQAQDLQAQSLQPPASAPPKAMAQDGSSAPSVPITQQAALAPPSPKVSARPATVRQPAPSPAGGAATYAALLASPVTSESDARSALDSLEKKYGATLGAHRLTYHRVKVGAAIVYEIRTAGLTDNQAKTLCGKLTSAGTPCKVGSN